MPEIKILCADALSYLPPIAFFARALAADVYLVADDIQFSTNGFCHRAKLKTSDGARMLSLPVLTKSRGQQFIKKVEIDRSRHWQRRHWRSIEVNYCHAAYFEQFADELSEFYRQPYCFLREVSLAFLNALWRWLEIKSPLRMASEFPSALKKEERLIEVANKTGAQIYLCDEAYRNVLSREAFDAASVRLQFSDFAGAAYPQLFGGFVSGLSVMDLLLNEGPQAARAYLETIAKRVRREITESVL
jgi:hypothetical protein